MSDSYEQFLSLARELSDLGHAQTLLSWDQETYMPSKAAQQRASSLGAIAGVLHERLVSPTLVGLVAELSERGLEGDGGVNVRELKREQDRAVKVPQDLVVKLTETESLAHAAWVEAREKSEFDLFRPWLDKILELKREIAHLVGFEGSIYNAFLDEYEPEARVEEVAPILEDLGRRLVPLVEGIGRIGKDPGRALRGKEFPVSQQEAFGMRVLADLGFDMEAGRLDVSVHPFCTSMSASDVRLTTRYGTDEFTQSLFGIIHECGHGLYEQGLPAEAAGTPLCSAVSLGIHESQSRLWENMVGRSREFWEHYLPLLKDAFPDQLRAIDLDSFYAAVNHVEPSTIRVEADEVTYNLHILLRTELEIGMVEGDIATADLPSVWNQRMEQYLGIRPPTDAEGVLQDVHWSFGGIGYFPTYALGNLYAAQLFDAAKRQLPGVMEDVGQGVFDGLLAWLRQHVHDRGTRLRAGELIEAISGQRLQSSFLTDYLETKFGQLYGLDG